MTGNHTSPERNAQHGTPNRLRAKTKARIRNLTLAAIAGQAGCVTLLVVLAALFIGLWLDTQIGRRGLCTFGLLILSVPVSLTLMVRLTLSALDRVQPQPRIKRKSPPPFEEE